VKTRSQRGAALRRGVRAAGLTLLAAAGAATFALLRSTGWLAAVGSRPRGERLDRIRRSPHWADGRFHNMIPTEMLKGSDVPETLWLQLGASAARYPRRPIPVVARAAADYAAPPASGLRVTWIGHATALVEIDGHRFLTDPMWSERSSPSSLLGPRRFFEPPIALLDLPPLDAVLISHDHYDHLDMETVRTLGRKGTRFLVPLGVGAHLETWGVAPAQIRELDWEESVAFGDIMVAATPARHFSGRGITGRDTTLWCSWVVAGPRHRVFYSGDSGYFDGYRAIGAAHGPFDAALMSLGSYGPTWPNVHMDPEELVRAHAELGGGLLVPVHWATFNLAFHAWNEPAARAEAAAAKEGVRIAFPRPGEMLEPSAPPAPSSGDWWREP
jgi:L-ascorbate metabolism protein UlaG (beta-lactamase superfamily)